MELTPELSVDDREQLQQEIAAAVTALRYRQQSHPAEDHFLLNTFFSSAAPAANRKGNG